MDYIKLAEAVSWPIAIVVMSIAAVSVTSMIVRKRGTFGLKFKDWFSLEANAHAQSPEPTPNPPSHLSSNGNVATNVTVNLENAGDSNHDIVQEEQSSSLLGFLDAKSLDSLDSEFSAWRSSSNDADLEFWHTVYIERRRRFGAQNTAKQLHDLAADNPSWTSPLTSLLRRAVEEHDGQAVDQLIVKIMSRLEVTRNRSEALRSVSYAYFEMISPERALSFFQSQVANGATPSDKAIILSAIATNYKSVGNTFGYQLFTEMSLLRDAASDSTRFYLSYSYSNSESFWALATSRYMSIGLGSDQYRWALNNLGVMFSGLNDALSIDYYAQSADMGTPLAKSNAARRMINDGHIFFGEKLLDSIDDQGDAAEHIASTRATALGRRRAMGKEADTITAYATSENRRYLSAVAKALRFAETGGHPARGRYASPDGQIMAYLDTVGLACRVTIGVLTFEGLVQASGAGYGGELTIPGQGVLGGSRLTIAALLADNNTLSFVVFPSSKSTSHHIRVQDLLLTAEQHDRLPSPETDQAAPEAL